MNYIYSSSASSPFRSLKSRTSTVCVRAFLQASLVEPPRLRYLTADIDQDDVVGFLNFLLSRLFHGFLAAGRGRIVRDQVK